MALGARALLIALLVLGSSGSILCQTRCLQIAGAPAVPQAEAEEVAGPHDGACHGGGTSSPEPLPERSGESCGEGCCTVLAHAAVTPDPLSPPAPAALPLAARIEIAGSLAKSDRLRESPPAACLDSPSRFRNPPLLI